MALKYLERYSSPSEPNKDSVTPLPGSTPTGAATPRSPAGPVAEVAPMRWRASDLRRDWTGGRRRRPVGGAPLDSSKARTSGSQAAFHPASGSPGMAEVEPDRKPNISRYL